MSPPQPTWSKIDQALTGLPQAYGAQTVQLVAHLTGWRLTLGSETAGFTGAFVQLQPKEIIIQRTEGETTLPIVDPDAATQLALFKIALAVSGICVLILWLTRQLSNKPAPVRR